MSGFLGFDGTRNVCIIPLAMCERHAEIKAKESPSSKSRVCSFIADPFD